MSWYQVATSNQTVVPFPRSTLVGYPGTKPDLGGLAACSR
jgi:hypothetical protein